MLPCVCSVIDYRWRQNVVKTKKWHKSMVRHLFQNYDTIYVHFFPTYTCNHSCYTIYVRFLSRILAFYSQVYDHFLTNAYICAQKNPYICVTNKHVVYAVAESRCIRGTKLYCQQTTPSCTMELKSIFSLNQACMAAMPALILFRARFGSYSLPSQ